MEGPNQIYHKNYILRYIVTLPIMKKYK